MDVIASIAEARIREAMARGEFDRLPSRGKRIRLDDLSAVPEELRVGYLLLKNAGVLPDEMQLRKDAITLAALLDACRDPDERVRRRRQLQITVARYRMLAERRLLRRRSAR